MSTNLRAMSDGVRDMGNQRAGLGADLAALKTKAAIDAVWPIAMRSGENGHGSSGNGAYAELGAAAHEHIADPAQRMRAVRMAMRIAPWKPGGPGHRNLAFQQLVIRLQSQ